MHPRRRYCASTAQTSDSENSDKQSDGFSSRRLKTRALQIKHVRRSTIPHRPAVDGPAATSRLPIENRRCTTGSAGLQWLRTDSAQLDPAQFFHALSFSVRRRSGSTETQLQGRQLPGFSGECGTAPCCLKGTIQAIFHKQRGRPVLAALDSADHDSLLIGVCASSLCGVPRPACVPELSSRSAGCRLSARSARWQRPLTKQEPGYRCRTFRRALDRHPSAA